MGRQREALAEAKTLNIKLVRLTVAGTLLVAGTWLLATEVQATHKGDAVKAVPQSDADPSRVVFGHIPASADKVLIVAENARVMVTQGTGDSAEISISSNTPRNWNLNGAQVRQAGFASKRGGVAMMADAFGNRAIVNGQVYVLPQGPMRGMNMGKDGVFIKVPSGPDGAMESKKLEPLPGSSMPGPGGATDVIEVSVPATYAGTLVVGAASTSEVIVPQWNGGALEVSLLGQGKLTAGEINAGPKAIINNRGSEAAQIDKLKAKLLVLNVTGAGKIKVKDGASDMTNVTVEGAGSIDMKGKYQKLQKAANGGGTISVNE